MRIAFIVGSFSLLSQTFVYERVTELVRQGHDVHVITMKRALAVERPYEQVHEISSPGLIRRRLLNLQIWLRGIATEDANKVECNRYAGYYRKKIADIISKIEPDIIHAEFGPMGTLAAPVANKLKLPMVLFMHGFDITLLGKQEKWRQCYRSMWPSIDLVLIPSEFMRERVIELGAPPDKTIVQHNGIDVNVWQFSDPSKRFDGSRVVFLFVGRLVEKKGLLQLVQAFGECRKRFDGDIESRLVICGNGPLLHDVESLIAKSGLTDSVELLGSCSHDKVREVMQNAHIMVQHNVTAKNGDMEGLPVSLTEAAAISLPIISTRHSGIPEIVMDGVNGFLVDENDISGMAKHMTTLMRMPQEWSRMGSAGRKLVLQEFEQSEVILQYIEKVEDVRKNFSHR